jgi:hypothetical protein
MNPNTENSEFCEQFVNKSAIIRLVEAGLDWNVQERNQPTTDAKQKDFPVLLGFSQVVSLQSCTAHHLKCDYSSSRLLP